MALSVIGLLSLGLYLVGTGLLGLIVDEETSRRGPKVGMRRRRVQDITRCCKRILIATFRKERLVGIEHLHTGPLCVGSVEAEEVGAWRRRHGLR